MQFVTAELPADELEFVGQSLQLADPVDALYFPATHAVHVSPSGPVHPVLQVQEALPAGELDPAGQVMHVELAEAPTAVEYVPAPQSVHSAAPFKVLYLPGMHAGHVPPSGPE